MLSHSQDLSKNGQLHFLLALQGFPPPWQNTSEDIQNFGIRVF